MTRYPRAVRGASIKCIGCNAPATETLDGSFVCVECGRPVVRARSGGDRRLGATARFEGVEVRKTVVVGDGEATRVEFEVDTTRESPVVVWFADRLPAGADPADVTFGSGEDRTNWTRSVNAVEHRCLVGIDGSVRTSYHLPGALEDPARLIDDPEILYVHDAGRAGAGPAANGPEPATPPGERPDGGTVQPAVPLSRVGREPGRGRLPAVAVVATAERADAAFRSLVRALTRGHQCLLTFRGPPDPELLEDARGLGVVVVTGAESAGRYRPERAVAAAARELSVPGVIVHRDPSRRIDYDRSVEAARTGGFVVEAVPLPEPMGPSSAGVMVAIPAYNEAGTIADVAGAAARYADAVLVVDDGSEDATASLAEAAGATVVRHDRQRGYGAALKTAFREARWRGTESLVIVDGDGQHDPADIPSLLEAVEAGEADVVIGSRFAPGAENDLPRYRRIGIGVINLLLNVSAGLITPSAYIRDTQSGFRAYGREAIEAVAGDPTISDDMDASVDILFTARSSRLRIEEVGTTVTYDVENPNSHNPVTHGLRIVRGILGTVERDRPITTMGLPGLVVLSAGVGLGYSVLAAVAAGEALVPSVVVASVLLVSLGLVACIAAAILHAFNLNAPRFARDRSF